MDLSTFKCVQCGNCCRWQGDVCIEDDEVASIADYLGMTEQAFIAEHCRLRANRQGLSIKDLPSGACSMLCEEGCRIHAVKPRQCKGFPYTWSFPGWEQECKGAQCLSKV